MKIERFIILVLLLLVGFLAYNKRPKYYHHQTDHVIEREIQVDLKEIDSLKGRILELENLKPKIITRIDSFKVEVEKAEILKDTSRMVVELKNVISSQDTLIDKLETSNKFYEQLVESCDSVMMNQNKLIEIKDAKIHEIGSELDKEKTKRKRGRVLHNIVHAVLGAFLIIK